MQFCKRLKSGTCCLLEREPCCRTGFVAGLTFTRLFEGSASHGCYKRGFSLKSIHVFIQYVERE